MVTDPTLTQHHIRNSQKRKSLFSASDSLGSPAVIYSTPSIETDDKIETLTACVFSFLSLDWVYAEINSTIETF
jgi:hypothetical protein